MKLSTALDGFLLAKRADGLPPNTIRIYRDALDKLVAFTAERLYRRRPVRVGSQVQAAHSLLGKKSAEGAVEVPGPA